MTRVLLHGYDLAKRNPMRSLLVAVMIISSVFLASCQDPDKDLLQGRWKTTEILTDGTERYLPDEMEFFSDSTMTMPGFADRRMPFKTDLTEDEKKQIREHYPELLGKNLLLIKLDPEEKDWSQSAVYQFTVAGDELTLRSITDNRAVLFRKVPSGAGK